jgi:hypothetical protein
MTSVASVRLGALALLAMASGCFSDRGLAIEVDAAGTGAASIELFLGQDGCDPSNPAGIDCKAIAPPPGGMAALPGAIWFRDDVAVDSAEVSDGTASFELRTDTEATVPIAIAIGLAADGTAVGSATLTDVAIPIHNARVIKTALVPVRPLQVGAPSNATEDRALVWRKTAPASSCVVVEHWQGGMVTRSFIVPREDPDCDDVPAPECNPAAWHGAAAAGDAGTPDCLSSQGGNCTLGSLACSDDAGPMGGGCATQGSERACVPDAFCGSPCDYGDQTCHRGLIQNVATLPRLECQVPTHIAPIDLCPDRQQATFELGSHLVDGTACNDAEISSLTLMGFDDHASFGGAVMSVKHAGAPCTFTITWETGIRATTDTTDVGMLEISGGDSAVLLPLALHFFHVVDPGCTGAQFSCDVRGDPNDSMWRCGP